MKSRLLALCFTVAFGFIATGPVLAAGGLFGDLNGTVSDQSTHAPIADALVIAKSPSGTYSAKTDAKGFYSILGMNVDEYTLTVTAKGYQTENVTGVTVFGDQKNVANVSLGKALATIAHLRTVAANSAFQPDQTIDSYSVTGQRVQQALGNSYNTDEATLLQSAPGVIATYDQGASMPNSLSIRGSLAVELGYQYDGIPFSAPFFNENGSQGFLNGINGGSGGGIQIVSGAGDATQGNVGGGVINTVAPRGTYPAAGHIDAEVGGPWYDHALNFDYAAATDNGKFSNYLSFSGQSYVPQQGPVDANTAELGTYFGTSYARHNDLVDNMVFRFGKNNHESLQLLGRVAFVDAYNGLGGTNGLYYFPNDPNYLNTWSGYFGGNNAYYASLIPTLPYQQPAGATVTGPEKVSANPLNFIKIGYTNSLNASTFLTLAYYNWALYTGGSNYTNYLNAGDFGTGWAVTGGQRSGFIGSITHSFGENDTLTLEGKYEFANPYWNNQVPGESAAGLAYSELGIFGGPLSPNASDWALPGNPAAVSGAGNPCSIAGGCYIHDWLVNNGKWTGTMPDVPTFGIGYHGTRQQQWGVGLRDQYSPNDKWNFDFGVRVDGEQNKFGPTPYNGPAGTPSDVGFSKVNSAFISPRETEPRFAFSYRVNRTNSVRFSYGRSTLFFFGQTLGTPFNVYGINPILNSIPAKSGAAPYCGSGYMDPNTPGYSLNTKIPTNGTQWFFPCQNYAASVAWYLDQNLDAPDLGGFGPPTYSNFDLAWSHLFTKGAFRGWSSRLTAYTRRGYNVEQNVLLLNGPPNPITGQSSASVFTTTAAGQEKTFGIEGQLTTPDVSLGEKGWSGFVTFDYINELLNTPPVTGSSNLPILGQQLFGTNQLFKAGFVPPLSAVIGATYHFKSGTTITPTLFVNDGYPFGVGTSSIGFVNGSLQTIPETNFGPNTPYAGSSGPNNAYNASYFVDPQVPGSIQNPNIAASRGIAEPAIAGLKNSPPEFFANLDFETPLSRQMTFGVQIFNVLDNHYGPPVVNTFYQPVANGVAGPLTGQLPTVGSKVGAGNEYYPGGSTLPYLNNYGTGRTWNVYLRTKI